jgi:hypothetical protein
LLLNAVCGDDKYEQNFSKNNEKKEDDSVTVKESECVIGEGLSRRPPTAEVLVQSQTSPCGICGWKSDLQQFPPPPLRS